MIIELVSLQIQSTMVAKIRYLVALAFAKTYKVCSFATFDCINLTLLTLPHFAYLPHVVYLSISILFCLKVKPSLLLSSFMVTL